MARRYGAKKRKSPKRVAAGKKAWRTKVRRYGKKKAVSMIGKKRKRKAKKRSRRTVIWTMRRGSTKKVYYHGSGGRFGHLALNS